MLIFIRQLFEEYSSKWPTTIEEDPFLLSEIRCLPCRMAMYTKAIQIAKEQGYKYIAEGARISQKFMLEQISITTRLKELAASHQIKLLFPVLYVDDDQKEIEELLNSASYSLPKNNVYDLIIRFCFIEGIYDLTEVNNLLVSYECKLFSY